MKGLPQISDAELEVMKTVWRAGGLTAGDITNGLAARGDLSWKPKTILTLINRLARKGALHVDRSSPKAYLYSAAVGEEEYRRHANESFLRRLYGGSLDMMLTAFIKDRAMSREDIAALKKLLDEED